MHRLTSRLLLLIVALGIFQPLLEAFSAEPHTPVVCGDCMRKNISRYSFAMQAS